MINIKLKIFNYYYYNNIDEENEEFNAPVLCLKCRDKDKNHHLIQVLDKENLMPRFGLLRKEGLSLVNDRWGFIKGVEDAPKSLYGEDVVNVFTNFPWQVGSIKRELEENKIQAFGADIKWEKKAMSIIIKMCGLKTSYIEVPDDYIYRFLKVKDIKALPEEEYFLIEGRICYWDIEADSRNFPAGKIKYEDFDDMPVVSITTMDSYNGDYYEFVWHPKFKKNIVKEYKDYEIPDNVFDGKILTIDKIIRYECISEAEMLKKFFEYFSKQKFEYMFGYFSAGGWSKVGKKKIWIDGFDALCLYKRAKILNIIGEMQNMSTCPQMYGYKGRYDAVYMRSSRGKHELLIKGVSQIDFVFSEKILAFAQKYYKFRGHKLADWARFFLGYNKLSKEDHQVYYYWDQSDITQEDNPTIDNNLGRVRNKGLEFMLDYNLIDVKICVDLDKRFDVTNKQVGRCEVSISPADDGLTASKLHDHFKLTHYQDRYSFDTKYQKFHRKDKEGKAQIGDKYTITLEILEEKAKARGEKVEYNSLKDVGKVGGFVPVPLGRGIYEDVAVIDFSKFYPNIIKSTNAGIISAIDIAKYDDEFVYDKNLMAWKREDLIETPIAFYRKDVKSLNSELFDNWMEKRVEAQKKLKEYVKKYKTTKTDKYILLWTEQFNIKNFMNAGFGVLGLRIDRGYSKLCFNSCTISCQDVILLCIKILKDFGVIVIGGDTDSTFIKLKAKDLHKQIKEAKRICEWLNRCIDYYMRKVYNVDEHTINIGLETISRKFLVDTMKHYIKENVYAEGVILEKPELEIKGMELKKRATSVIGAELQQNLIDIIFGMEDTTNKIKEYISDFDKKLQERSWCDVCKRGPLQKHLDKYPASNQSAESARNTLKYLGRYYDPGSNPFLGVFKKHPSQMNGKFLNNKGKNFTMSFDREDEEELRKLGFDLNWDTIRETECFKKTDHLLSIFGLNYYNIVESEEIGDSLLI